ncbi:MAG: DNA-3-methyladenine glycosylase [Sediminibacterium sp.]
MRMKTITPWHTAKLPIDFYQRENVLRIARALVGKVLVTEFDGLVTAGRIVETEAYQGVTDRASHAWNGRRTNRTEIMYQPGGAAYVYLCYGIHHLFNVVTHGAGTPHAVLIRGIAPLMGIDTMLLRTGKKKADHSLTRGPGNVAKALGILTKHTGISLTGDAIFIAEDTMKIRPAQLIATPRIGVGYAGEDALLPYRFILKDSPYVSGKNKQGQNFGQRTGLSAEGRRV